MHFAPAEECWKSLNTSYTTNTSLNTSIAAFYNVLQVNHHHYHQPPYPRPKKVSKLITSRQLLLFLLTWTGSPLSSPDALFSRSHFSFSPWYYVLNSINPPVVENTKHPRESDSILFTSSCTRWRLNCHRRALTLGLFKWRKIDLWRRFSGSLIHFNETRLRGYYYYTTGEEEGAREWVSVSKNTAFIL